MPMWGELKNSECLAIPSDPTGSPSGTLTFSLLVTLPAAQSILSPNRHRSFIH